MIQYSEASRSDLNGHAGTGYPACAGYDNVYASRIGGFSGVPRRNSSAFIGCLPARCSSRIRIAPSLQATVEAIVEHLA